MYHTLPLTHIIGSERRELLTTRQFREFNERFFKIMDVAFSEQTDDTEPPEQLHEELLQLLQSQLKELPPESSTDAQLVMVGLADELFLSKEWYGQVWWNSNPLEYSLFGTRSAGDKLYAIADRIISECSQNNVDLAAILLDAFSMGFTGKYGDSTNNIPTKYRTDLRESIMLGHTHEDFSREEIFPEAYNRAFNPATSRCLPSLKHWIFGAGIVGLILLIVSHLVWWSATAPLRDILKQIAV